MRRMPPDGPQVAADGAEDLGIPGLTGVEEVGRGGFATVYRAHQPAFGREVAVKVLDRRLDDRSLARFERERHALGLLSTHPAIATVHDAGTTPAGRPYLLMPFYAGGSLQDRLDAGRPVGWQEACGIGIRLCGALGAAHDAGVLHRDIKPANILVGRYGDVVLSDFGIARVVGGPETTSGQVTASLAHAAPEVLNGHRPSVASDVYGLASTLYALIAGASAFAVDTDESVLPHLHRILTAPVPRLDTDVPAAVQDAIVEAMAKDPADRPPSAAAFAARLIAALDAAGAPAPDLPPVPPAARPPPPATPAVPDLLSTAVGVAPPAPPVGVAGPAGADGSARGGGRRLVLVGGLVAVIGVVGVALALRSGDGSTADDGPDVDELAPIGLAEAPSVPYDEVQVLEPGAVAAGELEAGRAQAFRVPTPEAPYVWLLARGSGDVDPVISLQDADGVEQLADDDLGGGVDGHDALIAHPVDPSLAPLTLLLADFAGDSAGAYEVVAAPVEVRALGGDMAGTFSGDLTEAQAVAFTVEAADGDVLTADLRSDEVDSYLQLLAPDGTVVAEDDDSGQGGDAHIEVGVPHAGTYTLLATHRDPTESGPWELTAFLS